MEPNRDDVLQIVAALMTVTGSLERARRKGDASSLAILNIVATGGRVRPSDIAQDLGVHQSTVTRQVQALEAAGQVEVSADPEDGRSCFVSLTVQGQEEIRRLTEVGLSRFAEFVADWDAEEVRELGRLLMKLETSKAAVNTRERQRPEGRAWQRKTPVSSKGEGNGS